MKTSQLAVMLSAVWASTGIVPVRAAEKPISDDVVKVGVLDDMSGLYSDIGGKGAVTAVQMAVDDFSGKVLGKPIQVIAGDHQNKAEKARLGAGLLGLAAVAALGALIRKRRA